MIKTNIPRPFILFVGLLIGATTLHSCKLKNSEMEDDLHANIDFQAQCFGLRDGQVAASNAQPSVGLIAGQRVEIEAGRRVIYHNYCTGTWIADNAFLTANHCLNKVDGSDLRFVPGNDFRSLSLGDAYTRGVAPKKVLHYGHTREFFNTSNPTHTKEDIAIAIFDRAQSDHVSTLVDDRPTAGQTVNMIGYGLPEVNGDTNIVKRIGSNVVGSYPSYQNSIVVGKTSGDARTAALPGDSGSPLLKDDKIAGVLSSYIVLNGENSNNDPIVINVYVDILSPEVRKILLEAKEYGASISDEILSKPISQNQGSAFGVVNSFTDGSTLEYIESLVMGSNLNDVVKFKSDGSCQQ